MVFTHDTRESLSMAVDLVNTLPGMTVTGDDRMRSASDLTAFLAVHPYSGVVRGDDPERSAVRAIRPRLRELWHLDRDGAVAAVNAMLADGRARPRLVRHEPYDWHIHATNDDAPLATRMLVDAAMAVVDVIRADEYGRMRVCSAPDCRAVYVDLSRNRSKLYCDAGNCGNRVNVTAYRMRKARGSG
jgi:predicted RNA-binding Zn ribbon-like protein